MITSKREIDSYGVSPSEAIRYIRNLVSKNRINYYNLYNKMLLFSIQTSARTSLAENKRRCP